jgi:hypothetical protein
VTEHTQLDGRLLAVAHMHSTGRDGFSRPLVALALGFDLDDVVDWSFDQPPSRPMVVARSTASLRDETPSFL